MDAQLANQLDKLEMGIPPRGCLSQTPATKWDFGTVVGNGAQGALGFGRTRVETFVLSHEALFLPLFPDAGYLPVKPYLPEIREQVIQGHGLAVEALLRGLKKEGEFPGYNTTDPFVGACSLDLLMADVFSYSDYARSVDFERGEAVVGWEDEEGVFQRRFFFSRSDDVLVVSLRSLSGARLNLTVGLREIEYEPPTNPKDHDIYAKTIDHCEDEVDEAFLMHRMFFKQRWASQPVNGCCTVARVVAEGGTRTVADDQLVVRDADEVLLLVRTVPDRQGELLIPGDIVDDLSQIDADYDRLLLRHVKLHGEMFRRCRLSLAGAGASEETSDALIAGSSVGETTPKLVETLFDAGRYGIISSTGQLPPALQGVWTGTWKPRWSGDYTLNGNVQSMVAASLSGNHFECMASLLEYLYGLLADFRKNANELLGFRGPLIPWRSSSHGRTHYLAYRQYHHDFPGIFWFAGAAWFCRLFYDYYLYTADESFAETRLKPFLIDCLHFYEDYLTVEREGVYVLTPSSSPENQLENGAWIGPNATMTIAAIRELLRTGIRLAGLIEASEQDLERWRTMLKKLPAYAVGENGALKEWTWPGIENDETHRHASHLYPVYHGVAPEIAASPELREACRVAIERRMAHRRKDNGGFMAFGLVQMGMSAAHLGDTSLAYECLEYLVNRYWSPVMVSQHNSGEEPDVLNLDISGGLPALVIEMLVQSSAPKVEEPHVWRIQLLPCLPDAWPEGELCGVRCRGGFALNIAWRRGRLSSLSIAAPVERACRLCCGEQETLIRLNENERVTLSGDFEVVHE